MASYIVIITCHATGARCVIVQPRTREEAEAEAAKWRKPGMSVDVLPFDKARAKTPLDDPENEKSPAAG